MNVVERDTISAGEARQLLSALSALKKGNGSVRLPPGWTGLPGKLSEAFNEVADLNAGMALELARLRQTVGREGKLKQRASLGEVKGFWKDSIDSVNALIDDLVHPTSETARVIGAVAKGDLSQTLDLEIDDRPLRGEFLRAAITINKMVDQLGSFASEVTRVAREVGTEGKLGGQAKVKGVAGTWKDLTDSVNSMAGNLTAQVRNIADVTTAVARGDLSRKITVEVKGEMLELKNTVNTLVDQLRSFAAEVTRVAREVGTEGKLGGQAQVQGVSGTWKDLTDSVNFMAGNLTGQVRGIAKVVTAVADGDLKQKLTVEAKGEFAALAKTINNMIDTLAIFAEQVTSVAREVVVEGKLGGQAKVPGASGTWKGLTQNVNQLAENLTTQVRAIAEVATAVTQGDLTRSITLQAQGEVAALKDTINEMIRNLKDTTQKNTEQDWLKTNLAKFSRMLQGQKALKAVGGLILSELAPVVAAKHAEFYLLEMTDETQSLALLASYSSGGRRTHGKRLDIGEGLVGQCAIEKRKILLTNVPAGYMQIASGLGAAAPRNILVLPIIFESQIKGVIELASFEEFSDTHQAFLEQLTESIGIVINTIEANTRTEDLLTQSQSLAHELQSRQQELQQTNEELQEKARLLAHQNEEVERKNQEVEQARQALEEKARQLALTSKYKSEFLANMSHELRTPLNSLLILSDQLCLNAERNLSERQVDFAKTIHSSGNDLLMLINDILDLSKIESGTVAVEVGELRLEDLRKYVERTFRHVAESKNVQFSIELDRRLPKSIFTDSKRLQQIIKNLLSNAFKFTHQGEVTLAIQPASAGWHSDNEDLNGAAQVLAFAVSDTGIGIPLDKQQIVFEAFQQADGSTSRKYGGTGLGLAICRELSRLLHGEIRLVSRHRKGSVFTLYLPQAYAATRASRKSTDAAAAAANAAIQAAMHGAERSSDTHAERVIAAPETDVATLVNEAGDDRDSIRSGDQVLLIIENDLAFAGFLLDTAREKGFKGLVTSMGTAAFALVQQYRPSAITLDLSLADIDGWRVLARLKNNVATRHFPVYIISTEDARERAMRSGAKDFIAKPIQSKQVLNIMLDQMEAFLNASRKRVLVIDEQPAALDEIKDYIEGMPDVDILAAPDWQRARSALNGSSCDCIVVGGTAAETMLTTIAQEIHQCPINAETPLVVLRNGENPPLADAGGTVARHPRARQVHSLERLLDQTTLLLHQRVSALPEHHRSVLNDIYQSNKWLAGKKVLIVDDDIRNIFALSSVLEEYEMKIVSAENGRDAIDILKSQPDIDIVLMDIMMPELDGIDTMKAIREIDACKHLPIVAVTAKAMKGDRERCIEAGAWDYLSKPVERELLLSVLRAWLQR